jgi:hypothetical protein
MTRLLAFLFLITASTAHAQASNILPYQKPEGRTVLEMREDALRLMDSPPTTLRSETDLACMAVTIYHEARGESIEGQKAVASVILQRALVPDRWGDTPCEVVQPVQFSYLTSSRNFARIGRNEAWQKAVRVALTMLVTGPDDRLQGADHYHTHSVFPSWRHQMDKVAEIGNHRFYVDPDSRPRNSKGLLLASIPAKGFDNRGGVFVAGLGQIRSSSIPYTPYQQNQEILYARYVDPSELEQDQRSVEVYDWSGNGVPQKSTVSNSQIVASNTSSFEPVSPAPEATPVAYGFNPVRGVETGRVNIAQTKEKKPTQMGLKPLQIGFGPKLGLNP